MDEGGCFVCDKHRGRAPVPGGCLFQDDLVHASHGAIPEGRSSVVLGTLFVEPRRHAPGLEDLTDAEAMRLGLVTTHLARALQGATGAERVYSMVLGHHVPHLHVWLLPRYPETPPEYWGMRILEWRDAPRGGAPEVEALCDRIRARLAVPGSETHPIPSGYTSI